MQPVNTSQPTQLHDARLNRSPAHHSPPAKRRRTNAHPAPSPPLLPRTPPPTNATPETPPSVSPSPAPSRSQSQRPSHTRSRSESPSPPQSGSASRSRSQSPSRSRSPSRSGSASGSGSRSASRSGSRSRSRSRSRSISASVSPPTAKWFRKPSVVWYRGNDLRVEDHPALLAAAQRGGPVIPFFVWDPLDGFGSGLGNVKKWWLRESLTHLQRDLKRLGVNLYTRTGSSTQELRAFLLETGADAVFWNRCYEPDLLKRDEELRVELASEGFTAESFKAELLVEPWELSKSEVSPRFDTFHSYMRAWMTVPPPPPPFPSPSRLHSLTLPVPSTGVENLGLDVSRGVEESMNSCWTPGSAEAKIQLDRFLREVFPAFGEGRCRRHFDGTSRLSPHIRFGELSPRRMYHATRLRVSRWDGSSGRIPIVDKVSGPMDSRQDRSRTLGVGPSSSGQRSVRDGRGSTNSAKDGGAQPPSAQGASHADHGNSPYSDSNSGKAEHKSSGAQKKCVLPHISLSARAFLKNLCLRDFAYHVLFHNPDCNTRPLIREFSGFPWAQDRGSFVRWQDGTTGYPIVDAAMRELRQTGWIHNGMRFLLACFLTKHLLLPWARGLKEFYGLLIDGDHSSNALGWQWTAGSNTDAFPLKYIVNPVRVAYRHDPSGSYVRRWLPELSKLPAEFVHEPWKAPSEVLKAADIELGSTYPKRIINLADARCRAQKAVFAMKSLFAGSNIIRSLSSKNENDNMKEWPEEKPEVLRLKKTNSLSGKINLLPSLWALLQCDQQTPALSGSSTANDSLIAIDTASIVEGALAVPIEDQHESIEHALITAHEQARQNSSSPHLLGDLPTSDDHLERARLEMMSEVDPTAETHEQEADAPDERMTPMKYNHPEIVSHENHRGGHHGLPTTTAAQNITGIRRPRSQQEVEPVPLSGAETTPRSTPPHHVFPPTPYPVHPRLPPNPSHPSVHPFQTVPFSHPQPHPVQPGHPSTHHLPCQGIPPPSKTVGSQTTQLPHQVQQALQYPHAQTPTRHLQDPALHRRHGADALYSAPPPDSSNRGGFVSGAPRTNPIAPSPSVSATDLFGADPNASLYQHQMNMSQFYGFPHMMPMMGNPTVNGVERPDMMGVHGANNSQKYAMSSVLPVGYGMYGGNMFDPSLLGSSFPHNGGSYMTPSVPGSQAQAVAAGQVPHGMLPHPIYFHPPGGQEAMLPQQHAASMAPARQVSNSAGIQMPVPVGTVGAEGQASEQLAAVNGNANGAGASTANPEAANRSAGGQARQTPVGGGTSGEGRSASPTSPPIKPSPRAGSGKVTTRGGKSGTSRSKPAPRGRRNSQANGTGHRSKADGKGQGSNRGGTEGSSSKGDEKTSQESAPNPPLSLKSRQEILSSILDKNDHAYFNFAQFLSANYELTSNTDRQSSKDYVRLCNLKDDYHKQCKSDKDKLKIYRIKSFFSKILRLEVTGEWDRHNHGGVRGPYVYGIRLRQRTSTTNVQTTGVS